MSEKALSLLMLMRRANAVDIGEENTGAAARAGKAKLLVKAADASENALKRAEGFARSGNIQLVALPYKKQELSAALGLPGCSMAAVTDLGFADALMQELSRLDDAYAPQAEVVHEELLRVKQRSGRKSGGERKRIGKRRTKA